MSDKPNLKQFYIPEEQSFYLLSHKDAQKLKDWVNLCIDQLHRLGYQEIDLIGKGAFGFVFGGHDHEGRELVFKFSRITLPQHIQDRLEEEAFMLSCIEHKHIPELVEFQRVGKQAILVMERAMGMDLYEYSLLKGPLHPRLVLKIAGQLAELLTLLREHKQNDKLKSLVHGDIKPSNIMFDPLTETIGLIDWGSSVFAQLDESGQFISSNVMDLMSGDIQQTNARLGDVYFIGEDQLNGELSSPRFDEQGVAGTLYALASGQSCRFGHQVITALSCNLPLEFARTLNNMLSEDPKLRRQAGDYFMRNMATMKNIVVPEQVKTNYDAQVPVWNHLEIRDIETVVYSSRKSYLREQVAYNALAYVDDAQLDKYYKNFLEGMGETEKAFIAAVSRLAKYPVVGGLAVRWQKEGVYIDSSLNLYQPELRDAFVAAVNNVVILARAIFRDEGVFKACLFNAKVTLHIDRDDESQPFRPEPNLSIPFEIADISVLEDEKREHSYFEDGKDPDEYLELPQPLMEVIEHLNNIHHTGCIIFESLPTHLKIHSYYMLLNKDKEQEFRHCLQQIMEFVPLIKGLGVSGFMKLPYKDTKVFEHLEHLPEKYSPRNPLQSQ